MSKATHSPLGQWRGRTGGQVYRVSRGEQIVSAYQPKVSNPRTNGQVQQRTRFNLMTRLNALTPIELLRPFSATPATARALFSKSLMKGITVSTGASTPDEVIYTATIAPAAIHFGEGATLQPESFDWTQDISVTAETNVGVRVEVNSTILSQVKAVRVIDVCKRPALTGDYVQILYRDATEDNNIVSFNGTDMYHRIYIQFIMENSRGNALHGDAVTVDSSPDPISLTADASSAIVDYDRIGSSIYVMTVNVLSA